MLTLRLTILVALLGCTAVVVLCVAPSPAALLSSHSTQPSSAPHEAAARPTATSSPSSSSPFLHRFSLSSVWSSVLSLSSGVSSSSPSLSPPSPLTLPVSSPLASASHDASNGVDYTTAASAPSYLPAAQLRCSLQTADGGSHRSVTLQVGSPAQSLRLLVDTGSSDLVALNVSYCIRAPSTSRSCFNPFVSSSSSQSPTAVSSVSFSLPAYIDDGELLSDSSAHAALALANLPVQLVGANISLLLGATDLTMQDALLGYPTAATRQVSFVLSNPQAVFVPPIPSVNFPYSVSAVNSLSDVDGLLGMSYAPLSALAQLDAATYSSAFLAITQATQTQSESATFALDFADNIAYIGGIDGQSQHHYQYTL